jgi:hypothetical protein
MRPARLTTAITSGARREPLALVVELIRFGVRILARTRPQRPGSRRKPRLAFDKMKRHGASCQIRARGEAIVKEAFRSRPAGTGRVDKLDWFLERLSAVGSRHRASFQVRVAKFP